MRRSFYLKPVSSRAGPMQKGGRGPYDVSEEVWT